MTTLRLCLLTCVAAAGLRADPVVYFASDFEADPVGEQPVGVFTFSPSSNTAENGTVIIDATSTAPAPLSGRSVHLYDAGGGPTHWRFPFNGGADASNARVDVDFQRALSAAADDANTRVHLSVGRAGLSLNSSANRAFEVRLLNNGSLVVDSGAGTSPVADYPTTGINTLSLQLNSHDSEPVAYANDLGTGSVAPNTFELWLNGTLVGTFAFHATTSGGLDFTAEDNDLGQIAFYQDSSRQGAMVFDDLVITALADETAAPPPGGAAPYFEADFEADTAGERPAGPFTFSPGSNTETNGMVVLDADTEPANPLPGKSIYIYDLTGGSPTHLRFPFHGGVAVSDVRLDVDFQRAYAVGEDDEDTRVHLALGRPGLSLNSSANRPFELRLLNNGHLVVNSAAGTSTVAAYPTTGANRLTLLVNSHDTAAVAYDNELGAGSVAPNSFEVWLNGTLVGTYGFHLTTSGGLDFAGEDNDLGQFALYQDTGRQGGIVFDNLVIAPLAAGGEGPPPPAAEVLFSADFESDSVGERPAGLFTFSPGSNTATNGMVVVDATSDPASPLPGRSLSIYDLSNGNPTHFRFPFNGGTNVSDVRVEFDFQRAFPAEADDEDTRVHVALGRVGDSLNNSDFRPFEIRILNNGHLLVNSLAGTSTVGAYATTGANRLTLLANSHDSASVDYDNDLGTGTLLPNTLHVFLNGEAVGTFDFHVTPDPVNAPQIKFNEQDEDLGQFALYQDTSRQGGIVFDNLLISRINALTGPPAAPSDLAAEALTARAVQLTWTDNADDEQAHVVERRTGASGAFQVLATLAPDTEAYLDETVSPETDYTYRVRASHGLESEPSNEAAVTTPAQTLPLIVGATTSELTVVGGTAEVTLDLLGQEPLTVTWYRGESGDTSNPVADASGPRLTLAGLPAPTRVWARVSNASGSVDSNTIEIAVYTPRVIDVDSSVSLDAAVADARPGDTLRLAAGEYPDLVIRLQGDGREGHPITLRAAARGEVVLTGASRLELGGSWLVVDGLVFRGAYTGNDDEVVQFRSGGRVATDSRVTNLAMYDYVPADGDRTFWVSFYGQRNRLDHSYFSGHNVNGVTVVVWLDGNPNHHRIDHNHFDNRDAGGENGWETIRVGDSGTSMQDSHTLVERNLFTRVNGEIEIISNKSGRNVYRGNTFLECEGTLTLRHGNACLVEGNFFLGGLRPGTGGVRVIGEDHVVINNYFEGTTGRDGAAITVYAGVPNSPLNEYFAAHRALIAFNTFVGVRGTYLDLGTGFGSRDRTVLPTGVVIANNVLDAGAETSGVFITGTAAAAQTWQNNLVFGRPVGVGLTTGIVEADPRLVAEPFSGMYRPAQDSPVIDAAVGTFATVTHDIDGQERGAEKDIGADEVSSVSFTAFGPIGREVAGPSYLGATRELGVTPGKLVNHSTRALTLSGGGTLITGFVIGGNRPVPVLIRGAGPALTGLGVDGAMADPVLELFDRDGERVAENAKWGAEQAAALSAAFTAAGAFEFAAESEDTALLLDLAPGVYTAHLRSASGTPGEGLVEVYDLAGQGRNLVNQSSRTRLDGAGPPQIGGLVISGDSPKTVLVRAIGPTLATFGVEEALPNPRLRLFGRDGAEIGGNDDWGDEHAATLASAAQFVGAFPLTDGSADAAMLVALQPGLYTVHLSSEDGAGGVALIEIYEVSR